MNHRVFYYVRISCVSIFILTIIIILGVNLDIQADSLKNISKIIETQAQNSIVAVADIGIGEDIRKFCTGTLIEIPSIDKPLIITAAHCLVEQNKKILDPSRLRVFSQLSPELSTILPKKIHIHPSYLFDQSLYTYDIALIEVQIYGNSPQLLSLANESNDNIQLNKELLVVGVSSLTELASPQIITLEKKLSLFTDITLHFTQSNTPLEVGFSGGPVLLVQDNTLHIVGIVSHGTDYGNGEAIATRIYRLNNHDGSIADILLRMVPSH